MVINKKLEEKKLTIELDGRLDTTTAPDLEKEIKEIDGDVSMVEFDFSKLEYISSAGLRVLLVAQKLMNKQGDMVIKNVNDTVSEVFNVTGFSDILTVE